jgi:hypothetical protein
MVYREDSLVNWHAVLRKITQLVTALVLACMLQAVKASEVILSAENLNASLKEIQRVQQRLNAADADARGDLLYRLGTVIDELAMLLTNEAIVYETQQQGLLDLAIERTRGYGVNIRWFPDKQRFIYDGAAFRQYLDSFPEGRHAAESAFKLLEIEFFQSGGTDESALHAAVRHKQDYLRRYAGHELTAEAGLLLAIDYRDLWRLYRDRGDAAQAVRYSELALSQFQLVADGHKGTRQAQLAAGLRERLTDEMEKSSRTEQQEAASE